MTSAQHCLIALGANLTSRFGPPSATLRAALDALGAAGAAVTAVSRFYRTPCFPPGAGPDYVNAAARVTFPGSPGALLEVLHGIEAAHDRARLRRWGGRTLDLDLLACGDSVLPDGATFRHWQGLAPAAQQSTAPDRLILPHPRLQDRAFVLVPLADVAPDWTHPVLGKTVTGMLAVLPDADRAGAVAL